MITIFACACETSIHKKWILTIVLSEAAEFIGKRKMCPSDSIFSYVSESERNQCCLPTTTARMQ